MLTQEGDSYCFLLPDTSQRNEIIDIFALQLAVYVNQTNPYGQFRLLAPQGVLGTFSFAYSTYFMQAFHDYDYRLHLEPVSYNAQERAQPYIGANRLLMQQQYSDIFQETAFKFWRQLQQNLAAYFQKLLALNALSVDDLNILLLILPEHAKALCEQMLSMHEHALFASVTQATEALKEAAA